MDIQSKPSGGDGPAVMGLSVAVFLALCVVFLSLMVSAGVDFYVSRSTRVTQIKTIRWLIRLAVGIAALLLFPLFILFGAALVAALCWVFLLVFPFFWLALALQLRT